MGCGAADYITFCRVKDLQCPQFHTVTLCYLRMVSPAEISRSGFTVSVIFFLPV